MARGVNKVTLIGNQVMIRRSDIVVMEMQLPMLVLLQPNHGEIKIAGNNRNGLSGIVSFFLVDLPKLSVNIYIKVHKSMLRAVSKPINGKIKRGMTDIPRKL